jgi:hypothetical protein
MGNPGGGLREGEAVHHGTVILARRPMSGGGFLGPKARCARVERMPPVGRYRVGDGEASPAMETNGWDDYVSGRCW